MTQPAEVGCSTFSPVEIRIQFHNFQLRVLWGLGRAGSIRQVSRPPVDASICNIKPKGPLSYMARWEDMEIGSCLDHKNSALGAKLPAVHPRTVAKNNSVTSRNIVVQSIRCRILGGVSTRRCLWFGLFQLSGSVQGFFFGLAHWKCQTFYRPATLFENQLTHQRALVAMPRYGEERRRNKKMTDAASSLNTIEKEEIKEKFSNKTEIAA